MSDSIKDFTFPTPSEQVVRQMELSIAMAISDAIFGNHDETFFPKRLHEILTQGVRHLTERLDMYDKLAMDRMMCEPPKPIIITNNLLNGVYREGKKLEEGDYRFQDGSIVFIGEPRSKPDVAGPSAESCQSTPTPSTGESSR